MIAPTSRIADTESGTHETLEPEENDEPNREDEIRKRNQWIP